MSLRIGVEIGEWTLTAVWRAGAGWRARTVPRRADAPLVRDLGELLRPLARRRAGSRLAIAPPESYVRTVHLEAKAAAHPAAAVRELLPAMLPFDVDRAQVSVRPRRGHAGDVLVAACDRERLAVELDALWQAGWPVAAAIPSGVALVHAAGLSGALLRGPVLLMDIGERRTTLALAADQELVYARDVAVGLSHLITALTSEVSVGDRLLRLTADQARALAQRLGMPAPEAADVPGELPVARYIAMIQPVLEQLVGEVRRTLAAGGQAGLTAPPGALLVSGAGAALPGLDAWLTAQLGMPVTRLGIAASGRDAGTVSAVAAGLAAVGDLGWDLQPAPARQRRVVASLGIWLAQAGVVAAIAVACLAAHWQGQASQARQRLAALHERRSALEPVVALQAAVAAADEQERRLLVGAAVHAAWMRRFADQMPEAVRLSELEVAPGNAKMAGEAQPGSEPTAESHLSALRLSLEEHELCQDAQLSSNRGESLVTFTLECRLP